MPSVFPGMDPYLETPAFWPDFHARSITYCCDMLAEHLPANYEARIDERINLVEVPPEEIKLVRPDLAISQTSPSPTRLAAPAGTLTLEPVTVPLGILDEVRQTRLEILHRRDRTLVAVLELLSPHNKVGLGRGDYEAKRASVLRQPVHLVELDLLIAGERLAMRRPLPPGDYYALVAHSRRRPNCDVYAWTVRQPLPSIPIPLVDPDSDVWLDLAAVFALAYDRGRYDRAIDYSVAPRAPWRPDARKWIVERAKAALPSA